MLLLRVGRGLAETTLTKYSNFLVRAIGASHPALKDYAKSPSTHRLIR